MPDTDAGCEPRKCKASETSLSLSSETSVAKSTSTRVVPPPRPEHKSHRRSPWLSPFIWACSTLEVVTSFTALRKNTPFLFRRSRQGARRRCTRHRRTSSHGRNQTQNTISRAAQHHRCHPGWMEATNNTHVRMVYANGCGYGWPCVANSQFVLLGNNFAVFGNNNALHPDNAHWSHLPLLIRGQWFNCKIGKYVSREPAVTIA